MVVGLGKCSFIRRKTDVSRKDRDVCSRFARAQAVRMQGVPTQAEETSVMAEKGAARKKLNIGIIGAGRIGQVHAENINLNIKNANLIGVASGTRKLAEMCSLENGCEPYYDYHALLDVSEV